MKTITIKASDEFAHNLVELANQLHLSKSELIRQSVERFREQQGEALLKARMQASSKKVRVHSEIEEWDEALGDGLERL